MKKITSDWLESARMDLTLIGEIINRDDLSPLIAFHSQQCIEKAFKAIIEEYTDQSFKAHNLLFLYEKVKDIASFGFDDDELDLLAVLDRLYIDSRYPGQLGLLPNGKPTQKDSQEFFQFAQRVYEDTKQFLKSDDA